MKQTHISKWHPHSPPLSMSWSHQRGFRVRQSIPTACVRWGGVICLESVGSQGCTYISSLWTGEANMTSLPPCPLQRERERCVRIHVQILTLHTRRRGQKKKNTDIQLVSYFPMKGSVFTDHSVWPGTTLVVTQKEHLPSPPQTLLTECYGGCQLCALHIWGHLKRQHKQACRALT